MIGTLIGGIASLAGGLLGSSEADKQREQQAQEIQQAVDELTQQGVPSVEAQRQVLERYRSAGNLDPALEQAIDAGPSAYGDVNEDPTLRKARLDSLSELERIGESGGHTLADDANENKVLTDAGNRDKASRGAALQRLAQQGNLGSGFELAASLDANQDATTNANQSGLQMAATAQQRALDSLVKAGETAGNVSASDVALKSKKADAADALSKFNALGRRGVQTANVGAENKAQQFNLENNQRISDANTDVANREQIANKALLQTDYNNRMNKAKAVAAARTGQAQNTGEAAARTGAFYSGLGEGVGKLGAALDEQQTKKKPVDEEEDYV